MKWRRKKSLVNPRQQVWFGLELISVAFGFVILCAYLLFIPPTSEWFSTSNTLERSTLLENLGDLISQNWPLMIVAFLVLFVVGIIMSHRISGPIFGLLRVIEGWKTGDRSVRVRFRKYDYLISLMEPLNALLEREERDVETLKNLLMELEKNSDPGVNQRAREALKILSQRQEASE